MKRVLVNDQLDAQFFFLICLYSNSLHVSSTRVLIIRRIDCNNATSGICHLHGVTYTRCRINTINFPDDEHTSARNMQRTGINIYENGIVRQVGHLQELYQDVRSTEHKLCYHKPINLNFKF
jgi:hypothetical protein